MTKRCCVVNGELDVIKECSMFKNREECQQQKCQRKHAACSSVWSNSICVWHDSEKVCKPEPALCEIDMNCGVTQEECERNSQYKNSPLCKLVEGEGALCG